MLPRVMSGLLSFILAGLLFLPQPLATAGTTRLASEARVDLADGDFLKIPGPAWIPGEIIFINGFQTDSKKAVVGAEALAKRLGVGVTLCFNDCSNVVLDAPALLISKLGDFDLEVNAAADATFARTKKVVERGERVALIGHSLGGAVIQNVVNGLADAWRDNADRDEYLGRVSVVLVGAAVFGDGHAVGDGFPAGLAGRFSISDARDPVARDWGDVNDHFFDAEDAAHDLRDNYLRHIDARRFDQTGRLVVLGPTVLLEQVTAAADPADRVVRVRVMKIPGQSDRQSLNVAVPRAWKRLAWSVESPDVAITPMIDLPFWPDEPSRDAIRNGETTEWFLFNYLSGADLTRAPKTGLVVMIRPVP